MAKPLDADKPKIQMLLDIENIFGESTRGLGKFVLTLLACAVPVLLVIYTSLFIFIPWQILVVLEVIWCIRMFMIIQGEEKPRVANYKRVRDDAFAMMDGLVRLRTIHPQGCVEYINGAVAFFIITYNDSSKDVIGKSRQIDRFINLAVGKHPFDIYVQNLTDTDQLDKKYSNVKLFPDMDAAKDFMEIIDYNREVVESRSTLTKNIICVRGTKYQWKDILGDITTAINSESARVFRQCYLATDHDEIEEILSRDLDGNLDLDEMLRKRYYTGETFGSKIISYNYKDLKAEEEKRVEEIEDDMGFIPKM